MKTEQKQTALRAVPMGLFPTMGSLQQVIDLANSQLPINTPNAVLGLLMTYHNTMLKAINDEQEATGSY